MKLGNIDALAPDISNELAAVQDNLDKGLITEQKAFDTRRKLVASRLLYIAFTNKRRNNSQRSLAVGWGKMKNKMRKYGFPTV
jgi:hypothetical protein